MNEVIYATKKTYASVIYDSLQDVPWHMERATYCCFLSDLTRFMGSHCTGPGDCHKSRLHKSMGILYNIDVGL